MSIRSGGCTSRYSIVVVVHSSVEAIKEASELGGVHIQYDRFCGYLLSVKARREESDIYVDLYGRMDIPLLTPRKNGGERRSGVTTVAMPESGDGGTGGVGLVRALLLPP